MKTTIQQTFMFCLIWIIGMAANAADIPNNEIWYDASKKLSETTSSSSSGLHTNAFNTSILSHTFSNGKGVIKFDGSVTSIGDGAFSGCSGLTSVTIGNSVTSIGGSAFSGCSGLTSIEIPNSVTSIGNYAFYYCSSLTSVNIPNSVTSIGYGAFEGCSGLTSIEIPNSVTSIGIYAFEYCSSLTSVRIGDSVTSIGYGAFQGCSGLTSVTIGNSVTSIGSSAFSGCSGLTSVTIGNSVTSIGSSAFSGCKGLTSVTIPNSVTSIGDDAFYGCSGLTSINIPNSVTSIGSSAFYNCSGLPVVDGCRYADTYLVELVDKTLTSVNIKQGTRFVGNSAFYNCSGLTSIEIPNSVTSIGEYAFEGCSGLTSIEIPNSVTSIGRYAFSGCSGLTSVNIPNSVTSIGDYAFSGCSGLPVVDGCRYADTYLVELVDKTLTNVNIKSGTRFVGNSAFYNCSGLTSVNIPNSVTSIGEYAFEGCSGLTSVNIPNSVTSIGNYAFRNCSSLTSVTIGNSVTSIGYYAFYDCSSLKKVINCSSLNISKGSSGNGCVGYYASIIYNVNKEDITTTEDGLVIIDDVLVDYTGSGISVSIPSSVTSIGDYAFFGCSGLTSVTIPNSVTSIGEYAFEGCSGLTSIEIPNSVTSIGYYAFQGCKGLTSVTIPNSVTSIGNYAFRNCSSLTSVTIGNSVTSIGSSAFSGCSGLTSVTIGNSVTSIGSSAFSGCKGLTSVTIPNSVTSIGDDAFSGCSGLTSVTIGNSVTSIGYGAFQRCSGLTSVTIGNSVTSIGEWAFSRCSGLTSIEIPNSVTSIGDDSFYYCSSLTSVRIGDSVTSIGGSAFYKCSGLTSIYVNWNRPLSVSSGVFSGVDKTKCTLYVPQGTATMYMVAPTWIDFANIVELEITPQLGEQFIIDGVKYEISDVANHTVMVVANSYSGNVVIPATVTYNGASYAVTAIEHYAFANCTSLSSVQIPEGMTFIGDHAFENCAGLKKLEIPSSVIALQDWVAVGSGLEELVLGTQNGGFNSPWVPFCGFQGSTSLKKVTIYPGAVNVIHDGAFLGCVNLEEIIMPANITNIGGNAFNGCANLSSITCCATTAPALPEDAASTFVSVPETGTLYVPSGADYSSWLAVLGEGWTVSAIESDEPADPTPQPNVEGNILSEESYNFEGGTTGDWQMLDWNNNGGTANATVITPGYEGSAYSMLLTNPSATNNAYEAQIPISLGAEYLGKYELSFYAKASKEGAEIQFGAQYLPWAEDEKEWLGPVTNLTTDWQKYTLSVEIDGNLEAQGGVNTLYINFGKMVGTVELDRIALVPVEEDPVTPGDDEPGTVLSDMTSVGSQQVSIEREATMSYQTSTVDVDFDAVASLLGCETSEITVMAMSDDETLTSQTTANDPQGDEGYWLTTNGIVTGWAENNPSFFVYYDVEGNNIKIGHMENAFTQDATCAGTIYAVYKNKYYVINLNVDIVAEEEVDPSEELIPSTDISTLANTIYIPDMEYRPGDAFQIPIYLKSAEEDIIGFQFDLYIPDGIVLEKNARDKVKAPTFNAEADRTSSEYHTISAAEQEDGSIRVLCYSNENELILGTDGIVCDFNAAVSEEMAEGDYNIIIKNICLTKSDITEVNVDNVVSKFTVPSYILGDVNDDKKVTVTDIACTASHILGTTPEPFIFKAADVNTDERITVTDIAGIANIILTGGSSSAVKSRTAKFASKSANPSLEIVPFTLVPGTTSESVPLELIGEREDEFVGFQCDIYLPAGISWKKNSRGKLSAPTFNAETERTTSEYHTVSAAVQEDGSIRVLCYSTENWEILGKEGAVIDLPLTFDENLAPGVYDIIIKNTELTNTDIESVNPKEYKVSVLVGSPDMASLSLYGDFTTKAIAEYNTALAENTAVAAADLTGAYAIDEKKAFAFGNKNLLVYVKEGTAVANTQNVVEGSECENLVLTDKYSFNAPKSFTALKASYARTASENYGTIVLPFVPTKSDALFYEFTGAGDNSLDFTEAIGAEANVPYLYMANGQGEFTATNAQVAVTPETLSAKAGEWTFTGTYSDQKFTAEDEIYAMSSGSLYRNTGNLTVRPFRGYFTTDDASAVKSYNISIDGNTVGIDKLENETEAGEMYDLSGRKVNAPAKGIYIINNKKVLVK